MMPNRVLRAWLAACLLVGPVALLAGCGGSDSGTHVAVNKEKEDKVLKAMGDYMKKGQNKSKKAARR